VVASSSNTDASAMVQGQIKHVARHDPRKLKEEKWDPSMIHSNATHIHLNGTRIPIESLMGDQACKISGLSQPVSMRTCREMNRTTVPGFAFCIFPFIENGICLSTFTHLAAYRACFRIGARLCTAEELWQDNASSLGDCANDYQCVWAHCYGKYHRQYRIKRDGYCNETDSIGVGGHQVAAVRCCGGPHLNIHAYHVNNFSNYNPTYQQSGYNPDVNGAMTDPR
jgi:hypothetical protein